MIGYGKAERNQAIDAAHQPLLRGWSEGNLTRTPKPYMEVVGKVGLEPTKA
jgi:hypothetical protein